MLPCQPSNEVKKLLLQNVFSHRDNGKRRGTLVLTVLVQTFPLVFCAIWRFSQDILHLFLWLFLILFTGAEVDERQLVTMPWNQALIKT